MTRTSLPTKVWQNSRQRTQWMMTPDQDHLWNQTAFINLTLKYAWWLWYLLNYCVSHVMFVPWFEDYVRAWNVWIMFFMEQFYCDKLFALLCSPWPCQMYDTDMSDQLYKLKSLRLVRFSSTWWYRHGRFQKNWVSTMNWQSRSLIKTLLFGVAINISSLERYCEDYKHQEHE
jgi:hypothetical protein